MVTSNVEQNKITQNTKTSIDTSPVTVAAFNAIRGQQQSKTNTLSTSNITVAAANSLKAFDKQTQYLRTNKDNLSEHSPVHKVKVKVVTNQDNKEHTYFHSMSIDAQVTDFLHTCELRSPFHWDLMEYWEPIRQSCVVYGANQGDYKILFVGRVREIVQDGYELVVTLQNYGWKFKQDVPQSYANDNVINKNGLQIMYLMFEALKIDSYVISQAAKQRLKQVGINEDGNLVVNGEEIEEMPDLLERLKASNPSQFVSGKTLSQKIKEGELHNIKDINYTLKYEEKTPVMKKIESEGDAGGFSAGNSIYGADRQWGSASGGGSGGSGGGGAAVNKAKSGACSAPDRVCNVVQNNSMNAALKQIYLFNRDCVSSIESQKSAICSYAAKYPSYYTSQVKACLATMAKYSTRKDRRNGASETMSYVATCTTGAQITATAVNIAKAGSNIVKSVVTTAKNTVNNIINGGKQILKTLGLSWW